MKSDFIGNTSLPVQSMSSYRQLCTECRYLCHYWMLACLAGSSFLPISVYLHNFHEPVHLFSWQPYCTPKQTVVFLFPLYFFLFCQSHSKRPIKTLPLRHKHFRERDMFSVVPVVLFFFHPSVTWHGAAGPSHCDKLGLEMTKWAI